MRILFLTSRLPYPPNRGDRLRTYHFLKVLSREHRITLLSFIADDQETGYVAPLRHFCEDIQLIHRTPWQSQMATGLQLWRRRPLQSLYYRSPVMQGAVERLLARKRFDAVYVHLFRMAQYLDRRPKAYSILDLTDAISGEIERSLPYRSPTWRLVYRLELPRMRRYERDVVRRFDETWLISEAERQRLLDGRADNSIRVMPNGVDPVEFRPLGLPVGKPTLAFVGHMGVFHNIDAAEHLVHDILPRVRQSVPNVALNLIGAEPVAQVQRLGKTPGVRVLGHVPDLNAELNRATVFVAPIRFAAGVQNKVLEAMAAGLPVVTTAMVNAGLQAEDGRHLVLADDAEQIADAVTVLLRDADKRRQLGRAGREFVQQHFRWEAVSDRMKAVEQQLGG
jgi:sugar transferase (PEP-CTERM/EpsH1 system associated)